MPLPGDYSAGAERGERSLSSTSQHHRRQDNEGRLPGVEHSPESDELSRNVLGLIGAYRMGSALDARDLFPPRSAPASEFAPAT